MALNPVRPHLGAQMYTHYTESFRERNYQACRFVLRDLLMLPNLATNTTARRVVNNIEAFHSASGVFDADTSASMAGRIENIVNDLALYEVDPVVERANRRKLPKGSTDSEEDATLSEIIGMLKNYDEETILGMLVLHYPVIRNMLSDAKEHSDTLEKMLVAACLSLHQNSVNIPETVYDFWEGHRRSAIEQYAIERERLLAVIKEGEDAAAVLRKLDGDMPFREDTRKPRRRVKLPRSSR